MANDKHGDGVSGYFNTDTVNPIKKATSTIKHSIAHNRRTIQAAHGARSNIDPTRSHLNYCLAGDACVSAIEQRVANGMVEHKARKNAPHAVEALVSLPTNWKGDTRALFVDTLNYLTGKLGADNLLSADVHLDEANPHMHVLFMPLEFCDKKRRLVWRSTINNRTRELYDGFFAEVGAKHGVHKPIQLSANMRSRLAVAVIDTMNRCGDGAIKSSAWEAVKTAIKAKPMAFAQLLGIDLCVFTGNNNPIGTFQATDNSLGSFGVVKVGEKQNSLPVYGVSKSPATTLKVRTGELAKGLHTVMPSRNQSEPSKAPASGTAPAMPHKSAGNANTAASEWANTYSDEKETTRVRDADQSPEHGCWDDNNDWKAYPASLPSQARLTAQAVVGRQVQSRQVARQIRINK